MTDDRRSAGSHESLFGRVREIVIAFEEEWRAGRRQAIDDVVRQANLGAEEWELRRPLIEVEFELRLEDAVAEPWPQVEEYLARYPRLADPLSYGVVWGLISIETRWLRKKAVLPSIDQYEARFPRHRDALRAHFAGAGSDAPVVPGYDIQGVLGQGGLGVVYRAKHRKLDRQVALKVLSARAKRLVAADQDDLVLKEARLVAGLAHPHIVQLLDSGETDKGDTYFTMEVLGGGTLHSRLAEGPLDIRTAAVLVANMADAVHHAHLASVLHCDIKPANILFTTVGVPKLTDFGLGRRLAEGAELTETQMVRGTPAFMAPEQAAVGTKQIKQAADIYALGAVLYACLTGGPPQVGNTPEEICSQLREGREPVRVRDRRPDVPIDLQTVCEKCLRRTPPDRYKSAQALASDLTAFLAGRPVQARPVGAVTRSVKWVRRYPVQTALAAAVSLVLVFAAGYFRQRQITAEVAVDAERQTSAEKDGRRLSESRSKAKLAFQRGLLREGTAALDEYQVQAGTLPPDLSLEKARALLDLNESEAFEVVMRGVDREALPPAVLGRWHLLWGEYRLGTDNADAAFHISEALVTGLGQADKHFAEGLQAKQSLDALGAFQRAYTLEPSYLSPRLMAMLILFTLGRTQELLILANESQLLYPDTPLLGVMKAITYAIRDELPEADNALTKIRPQLKAGDAKAVKALLPLLAFIQQLCRGKAGKADLLWLLVTTPELSAKLYERQLDITGLFNVRVPPALEPVVRSLLTINQQALVHVLNGQKMDRPYLLSNDQVSALGNLVATHPEGYLRHVYALECDFRNPMPPQLSPANWKEYRNKRAEVSRLYETAYQCKGHLFDFQSLSLDLAVANLLLAGQAKHGCPEDTARVNQAVRLVRLQMSPPAHPQSGLHALQVTTFARAALAVGDVQLARRVLTSFGKPITDHPALLPTVASVEFAARAYLPALEAARAYLATKPADAGTVKEMRDVERKCLEEFRKSHEQPSTKP